MPFSSTKIPLSDTGRFSDLILDYINRKPELRPFYAYAPEISSFGKAIADRAVLPLNREILVTALRSQYEGLAGSGLVLENINALTNSQTYTVCTGHQLCLFTGPLYFIYKILSTINLAEELGKQYPENKFVPVYWMASEDHDFEEISSVNLFGKKISWEEPAAGGPVGRLSTASLSPVLKEMEQVLGDSEHAKTLSGLFRDAYTKHKTLAEATRFLVNRLFGKFGLVVIDGDDPKLKTEFLEIMKDDIAKQTNYKLVSESIKELRKQGYEIQVNPREINVFRMSNSSRTRIESSGSEMLNLQPAEYSPNVVLRPLYQQRILPNLAYIGGPGELAYWLEYKAMFDHHKILFPVLVPRNFAMMADERSIQQLSKLGLTMNDLFKEQDSLIKAYISSAAQTELSFSKETEELSHLFSLIADKAAAIDPTLKASAEAELQKSLQGIKNIEAKLLRAEKQKQETGINQVKKLKEKFFPSGSLQERYDNFAPYYLRSGERLISDLKEQFRPFETSMLILQEQGANDHKNKTEIEAANK